MRTTRNNARTLTSAILLFAIGNSFAQTSAVATPTPVAATTVSVGQTVTVGSQAFVISSKKELAPGVEYCALTATTLNAKPANYLRTLDTFNPTVFTQEQYAAFLKTGKVSSFGTMKTGVVNGRNVTYATIGTSTAVFAGNKDGKALTIFEFVGDLQTLAAKNTDLGSHPASKECAGHCNFMESLCYAIMGADNNTCSNGWFRCIDDCQNANTGSKPSLNVLLPRLPVSF